MEHRTHSRRECTPIFAASYRAPGTTFTQPISVPGKRAYRTSEVPLHMDGYPTNRDLGWRSLIKFIQLSVGHRAYGSVRMFVEAIQGDMLPRNEACLHKSPNDNSEGAIRFGLHNDSNRSWTRLDDQLLGRLGRQLLEFFLSSSCVSFRSRSPRSLTIFRSVARDLGNVRIGGNLQNQPITCGRMQTS